jgi:NADP-dependent 3-hydroxy acid dehydrogenase YdfG
MPDLIDLAGRCVIVTGASSGIGESTARLLHAAGAHPVLAARRADRLAALSKELDGALAVPTDVTDPAQVRELVAAALDRHQRIDGLVNNAGASLHGPLDQVDVAEFSRILQLNVAGLLAMTQAVLPAMRQQGFGRIVNISSGTSRRTAVRLGAYASTKSAVNMLSAVMRQELADDGIAVSLLLPSITATEFGDSMFTLGASPRAGMVVHSPDYVAGVVLRLLRTGEESFDMPHGPERPDVAQVVRPLSG